MWPSELQAIRGFQATQQLDNLASNIGESTMSFLKSLPRIAFVLAPLLALSLTSSAAPIEPQAQTTLAIFPDRSTAPLSPELLAALKSSLRANLAANDSELLPLLPYSSEIQILPSDKVVPGLVVTNSVTIYLHGGCNPGSRPTRYLEPLSSRTLGWVERRDGQIEPFVHIDCGHITQFLQPELRGKSLDQQNQILAQAIVRVLLHEWLHIVSQDPHHAKEGIAKAQFTRSDILFKPSAKAPIVSSNATLTSSEPSAGK
jgi:hypothetical protein